jgi:general nucleoside transport system ATP-binding protein
MRKEKTTEINFREGVKPGETVLELRNITKRFPGVLANDQINFSVKAGEVHALLGENGAGKTTLMNIIYGLYQPDEGEIYLRGKKVVISSPLDAIALGIGMVHQRFKLVPSLTVTENIILGLKEGGITGGKKRVAKRIEELSEEFSLRVDPHARIWQLSAGEKQRVEILKMLYRNAQILVLDEPTSILTPAEAEQLSLLLRRMATEEMAVVPFITHKLPEVIATSDRVTVLRRGRVVEEIRTDRTNPRDLARKMVGKSVLFHLEKPEVDIGGPVLEIENLQALNDKGLSALNGISLTIREGEILGIAGVAGNGQSELAEVIAGMRPVLSGKISLLGEDITNLSTRKRIEKGIGHIPEEYMMGIVPDFSVADNLVLDKYFEEPFAHRWGLDRKAVDHFAEEMIPRYNIRTPSKETPAIHLSGGNLQKLILAREISHHPRLLITNLPTHGLDVGATEFIHNQLLALKKEQCAILLISEDLDEILSISDRIAVLYEGRITGIMPAGEAKKDTIGALMAGMEF